MSDPMTNGKHGTRGRYRLGCRCVGCSRSNFARDRVPADLRWSVRYLTDRHAKVLVDDCVFTVTGETLDTVGTDGLADFDADKVALLLGDHPGVVWPGWIEAGEDYGDA